MAFNNLKTLKLNELKGSQFAGVGNIFADPTSQSDFRQIGLIKDVAIKSLTFTGGMPWPDSLKQSNAELNNSNVTVTPASQYPNESESNSYLCKLENFSATVAGGTSGIQLILTDGSTVVELGGGSVTAAAPLKLQFDNVYFNQNVSLKIIEALSNASTIAFTTSIVSRGGNPQ